MAAAQQAAQRLIAAQANEFSSCLKVVGDGLTKTNWEDYKRHIRRLAFKYDWDPGLLDLDVAAHPWSIANENDEMKQDRKNFFMLLCTTAGDYCHLFNSCVDGDAQTAWKLLNDEFTGSTAAGYNSLSDRFNNCTQSQSCTTVSH